MKKINEINLKKWKEYEDILTDSLWIINKRDSSSSHKGDYHGNFVPQIPNQLLQRYTKTGDWVLDPFLGSGTTLIECANLNRNGIGIEINKDTLKMAKERTNNLKSESLLEHINADSGAVDLSENLKKLDIDKVQFILYHPPYWDIIKFNDNEKNIANSKNLKDFLDGFEIIFVNTIKHLEQNRYFAIVIGDIYKNSEWIPLNTYLNNMILSKGYLLKSIIVKNFNETKGKSKNTSLWRYRSLLGGFYVFKHEYILVFQNKKAKMNYSFDEI